MNLLYEYKFEGQETLQIITDHVDGVEVPKICLHKIVNGQLRSASFALYDVDRDKSLVEDIYSQLGRWLKAKADRERAIKEETEKYQNAGETK